MILVTGTKRSGTSMWMQILKSAGYSIIGKPFISNWGKSIKSANLNGFYESMLRQGVFYATNPDPKSGRYLFPEQTKAHILKVFVPGLIKTDIAFIDRVVATIRPWKEFCSSIRRLYDLEDKYMGKMAPVNGFEPMELARLRRGTLHPALEWWRCNYDLIRDFATRRYAFNLVSYSKLLESPDEIIPDVLKWCGGGDQEAAIASVMPEMRTQLDTDVDDAPICGETALLFDEFHAHFYHGEALCDSFITKLNEMDEKLAPRINAQKRLDFDSLRSRLRESGMIQLEIDKEIERTKFDAPWGPVD